MSRKRGSRCLVIPAVVCLIGVGMSAASLPATRTAAAAATPLAITRAPSGAACLDVLASTCLTPLQLETAYGETDLLASGDTGAGRTICIVDSFGSPTIARDAAAFSAALGLPAPQLTIVTPAGRIPAYNSSYDRAGWAGETSLDVEMAHAMAPGAAIVLAETPTSETEGMHGFPEIATTMSWLVAHEPCDVISQSYGATEQTFTSPAQIIALRDKMLKPAARRGITLLSSSGDDGATDFRLDGETLFGTPVDSWPSTDPLVTSVGGTRIDLNAAGHRIGPDNAWGGRVGSDAGGGGLSSVFSRPAFQNDVRHTVGNHRGTPDISLDAAPESAVLTYEGFADNTSPGIGNWRVEAGTSAAAPLFAGIVAVAAQAAGHRLGWLNPLLYGPLSAHGTAATNGILDVTHGSSDIVGHVNPNGTTSSVKGYAAIRGYDLATGLGTVNAARLVPALVAATRKK